MNGCAVSTNQSFNGIRATFFDSDDLRVVVLDGKGTDISEIVHKTLKLNLLFRNPWGPKSPMLFPPVSPHDQTFRDYTGGGWSDIIPNAGDPCRVRGASFGLHDETPLLQWWVSGSEQSPAGASATFEVNLNKYPFHVKKQIGIDSDSAITIEETLENTSRQSLPFSWLVHPTFGWNFVGGHATIEIPASKILRMNEPEKSWEFPTFTDSDGIERNVTEVPAADAVLDSTLVLGGLDRGRYSIRNDSLGLAFELSWDRDVFPWLWYYRSINAQNYPYYGRSKFIALEPCTSRFSGLASQVRADDTPYLESGEKLTTKIIAKVRKLDA